MIYIYNVKIKYINYKYILSKLCQPYDIIVNDKIIGLLFQTNSQEI